jgi:hypothetical protein
VKRYGEGTTSWEWWAISGGWGGAELVLSDQGKFKSTEELHR